MRRLHYGNGRLHKRICWLVFPASSSARDASNPPSRISLSRGVFTVQRTCAWLTTIVAISQLEACISTREFR